MTQIAIQQQIEVIRKASAEALKSKETARQFLIDAGIIKDLKKVQTSAKRNKQRWLIINLSRLLVSIVVIVSLACAF